MTQYAGFIGGAYLARSTAINAQRLVNMFAQKDESGSGKNVAALIGTPGTRLLVALGGADGVRGLWKPTTGNLIAVQGSKVYRISTGWVATLVGNIDYGTGPVSITDNGIDAVIVDGANGYSLNLASNVLTQITSSAFYGSDRADYLDDYIIFNRPDTGQFYITAAGDLTLDALDFASAEGAPDNIVAFIVDHRQLIIFGSESGEIFENTGNADFPIERSGNVFIEQGCAAKFGICKIDDTVFWLGGGKAGYGMVWRLDGAKPTRISTHALETAIQGYSTIADCICFAQQQDGHSFVWFIFPTANATWVFDASTGLWHERAYLLNGVLHRHRANCHAFFNNTHVVGDWENGNLYALDMDYYSDNGAEMPAIRAAAYVSDKDYKRLRHDGMQIDFETGVGLQTGQGSSPQAALDWSDDGGKTWSSQHWKSIGAVGEYADKVRWKRLGQDKGKGRVYRVTVSDPVKRVMVGASIDVQGLMS